MKRTTKIFLASLLFIFILLTASICYVAQLEKEYRQSADYHDTHIPTESPQQE